MSSGLLHFCVVCGRHKFVIYHPRENLPEIRDNLWVFSGSEVFCLRRSAMYVRAKQLYLREGSYLFLFQFDYVGISDRLLNDDDCVFVGQRMYPWTYTTMATLQTESFETSLEGEYNYLVRYCHGGSHFSLLRELDLILAELGRTRHSLLEILHQLYVCEGDTANTIIALELQR